MRKSRAADPKRIPARLVRDGERRALIEPDLEEVEFAVLEWVDWLNNRRLLSSIGDIPPAELEAMYYEAQESSAKEAGLN